MTLREFVSFKVAWEVDMSCIKHLCVSVDPVHLDDFDNADMGLRLDWEIKSIVPDPDNLDVLNVEVEPPGYDPYRDALNTIYKMLDDFISENIVDDSEFVDFIGKVYELAGSTILKFN